MCDISKGVADTLQLARYLGWSVAFCMFFTCGDCYTTQKLAHLVSLMTPLLQRVLPFLQAGVFVSLVACIFQQ
jgi:hypothetical protein